MPVTFALPASPGAGLLLACALQTEELVDKWSGSWMVTPSMSSSTSPGGSQLTAEDAEGAEKTANDGGFLTDRDS